MATAAPSPQSNPPNPQIPSSQSSTAANVSEFTFAQKDPAGYKEYVAFRNQEAAALREKYTAEEIENFGSVDARARNRIATVSQSQATVAANQQFSQQIVTAGAGTVTQTTTPLLPTQPVPPISSNTAPVTPASNPQAPAAAPTPPPGRPLLPLRDDGSGFNRQIGDVREDGAVLTRFLSDGTPVFVINASATNSAVSPTANPQVPPPPREFPNPAPGESRLVNTLEDFGPVTNPPIVVPAPAAVAVDPADITGGESAFVPTTPDPLATPGAVNPATNAQVTSAPGLTSTTVTNVNEGKFRADDPQGYAQFKAFEKQQQAEEVARLTAITQEQSGRNFLTARERSIVNADAATLAREDAIKKFTPQIQNAGAAIQTTTQGPAGQVKTAIPGPVDPATDPASREFVNTGGGAATGIRRVPARPAVQEAAARNNARAQPQVQNQRAQAAGGDWRLKLRLAPGSNYLYNAGEPGILQPLKVTDGVIFPYTPAITTTYTALYNNYDLTHSNYKGYFYQGSHVGELNITATFTAQDSNEAAYLLAVIQFFRSVTKMFYGQQDSFRGSPPPLVFLQGYGDFQFNLNPCVVQTFNYNLPADVDYIRAGAPNINGTNLLQRRDRQTATVGTNNPSASRMSAAGLSPGGTRPPPPPTTLGRAQPTYVPTKMEITLVLLPMQTRSQVSRQFSMEKFANGSLVQRGFW